jgi:hypothetical protein
VKSSGSGRLWKAYQVGIAPAHVGVLVLSASKSPKVSHFERAMAARRVWRGESEMGVGSGLILQLLLRGGGENLGEVNKVVGPAFDDSWRRDPPELHAWSTFWWGVSSGADMMTQHCMLCPPSTNLCR